jgi:hypothetical protein
MQGKTTPAEMAPLMVKEYLTDNFSMRMRVVFAKISPPKPDPPLAIP